MAGVGADFVIVQPPAENTLTGGYLYNRRVVEHAPGAAIVESLDAWPAAKVIVLDSLWLASRGADAVARVRTGGSARVAWLLHGLPSMWRDGASGPDAAELAALAQADALVAPGGFLPRLCAARGLSTPAHVCPPGVAPELAALGATPRPPGDPPVILTVATVTRAKGHDVLCAALATLAHLPWRWRLVGDLATDAAFVAELRARVDASGLAARVDWLGPRPPGALVDDYRAAAVLALPSRSENAPLVLGEAQAAGVPVVASHVGGVAELVAHGADGLLVPPDDAPRLADALARVLAEREAFAARAAARGRTLPTWPAASAGFALAMHWIAARV